MYAPGIVGIAVGLLILLIMKDSPESIGYPPIEPKKAHAGKPCRHLKQHLSPVYVVHRYAAKIWQIRDVR